MTKWIGVADKKDLQPGTSICVEAAGHPIALFNVEGTFYAIAETCTHRGGPLSQGEVDTTTVTCLWHGAQFDLRTGDVLGPPAPEGVASYKVLLEEGRVKVEIP